MLGRTHFFIGTAAALAVLQPQTVPALVAGAGAAAIGGLISDIDVGTSQAHRDADKIITATVAVAVLTILAEYKLNLGIYRRLTSDSSVLRLLAGTAAFLLALRLRETAAAPLLHALICGAGTADGVRGHHLPGCLRLFCRGLSVPPGARCSEPETGKASLAVEEGLLSWTLLGTGSGEPRAAWRGNGISYCNTGAFRSCRTASGKDYEGNLWINLD